MPVTQINTFHFADEFSMAHMVVVDVVEENLMLVFEEDPIASEGIFSSSLVIAASVERISFAH